MNEKRIKNIIKLVIWISIVSIVGSIIVIYIKNVIKDEKIKTIQADLLLLQAKIEIVKGNNSMNKDENPLKGYQLNQIPEDIDLSEFFEKNIISQEEYEKYYVLDSKSLNELDLQDFISKYKGYFVVNYDNYEVIYTKGYQNVNGLWCYKLSELNKMPEANQNQITENKENQETEENKQSEGNEENKESGEN